MLSLLNHKKYATIWSIRESIVKVWKCKEIWKSLIKLKKKVIQWNQGCESLPMAKNITMM